MPLEIRPRGNDPVVPVTPPEPAIVDVPTIAAPKVQPGAVEGPEAPKADKPEAAPRSKLRKMLSAVAKHAKTAALIGVAVATLVGGGLALKQNLDHAPRGPVVPVETPVDVAPPSIPATPRGPTIPVAPTDTAPTTTPGPRIPAEPTEVTPGDTLPGGARVDRPVERPPAPRTFRPHEIRLPGTVGPE